MNLTRISQHFSKSWEKLIFFNLGKNENIGEDRICNFSTNFLGDREILREEAKY